MYTTLKSSLAVWIKVTTTGLIMWHLGNMESTEIVCTLPFSDSGRKKSVTRDMHFLLSSIVVILSNLTSFSK